MKEQRDPTSENEILTNPRLLRMGAGYAESTLGARWSEWEEAVLAAIETDPPPLLMGAVATNAENVVGKRWPELEPVLLEGVANAYDNDDFYDNEDFAVGYAEGVIRGRWPPTRGNHSCGSLLA